MDVARQMAPSGATALEIARAAGSSEARVAEARIVLRHSAELAEAVSAGRIGLGPAWRQTRAAKEHVPDDLEGVTDLSVAELARLLHVCTRTIYTHVKNGRIRADPGRRPLRIPAQAIRDYLAATGTSSHGQEDMLTRQQAAHVLRIPPSWVTSLARQGRLPYERTPGGHARFPDAAVRALLAAPLHSPSQRPGSGAHGANSGHGGR